MAACSGAGLKKDPATGATPRDDTQTEPGSTQSLYRVQYSGPDGSGGLRLVLRQASSGRFQLATADTLGRKLLSLEHDGDQTLFVDHRERVFCEGGPDLRLQETTLRVLPLSAIPRVLSGELPIDLQDGVVRGSSMEYQDSDGRRWSVRSEEATVVAWTMWSEETPTLWWTRQNKGGILSHHDGSQFRWRQVVLEETGVSLEALRAPDGFSRVQCDDYDFPEFRQDQPPPAGDGAQR